MVIQKTESKKSLQEAAKLKTTLQPSTSPVKMDKDDLTTLQSLQAETDKLIYNLGQVWVNKEKIQSTEDTLRTRLKEIETKEIEIGKQLSSKYGIGTVDINTGTFTPKA